MSEKAKFINFLSNLNDESTSEEILEEVLAYFKIQEGIKAIEKGELLTIDEMLEAIAQC